MNLSIRYFEYYVNTYFGNFVMAILDSLKILLGVDPAGVNKGMQQAENRIQSGVKNIISNMIGPLTAAFGAAQMFSGYISNADKLGKLSEKLGMDVSDIDAWSSAVENAGGSADAFQSTLSSFNDQLRNAALTGSGDGVMWLHYLGVGARTAEGKLKNLTDVLPDLASRVEGMSKLKSTYVLKKIGLDEGTIALVQKGRASVDSLVASMKLFSYSKRDADTAREFNASMHLLGKGTQSVANVIFRELTPVITKMATEFIRFVVFLREHEPFVVAFFGLLVAYSLRFLAAWLANPIVLVITGIIAVVSALAAVIDDLIVYMEGGESALEDFWALFGTGPEIAENLKAAWESLKATGIAVFETLKNELLLLLSFFEPVLEPLIAIFTNFISFISNLMQGKFFEAGEALKNIFSAVGNVIKGIFEGIITYLWNQIQQLWSWVSNLSFDSLNKKASDFVDGLFGNDKKSKEAAKVEPTNTNSALNAGTFDNLGAMAAGEEPRPATPREHADRQIPRIAPPPTVAEAALPKLAQYMHPAPATGESTVPAASVPPLAAQPESGKTPVVATLNPAILATLNNISAAGASRQATQGPASAGAKPAMVSKETKVDFNISNFTVNTNATNADGTFNDSADAFKQQFGQMLGPSLSGVNP